MALFWTFSGFSDKFDKLGPQNVTFLDHFWRVRPGPGRTRNIKWAYGPFSSGPCRDRKKGQKRGPKMTHFGVSRGVRPLGMGSDPEGVQDPTPSRHGVGSRGGPRSDPILAWGPRQVPKDPKTSTEGYWWIHQYGMGPHPQESSMDYHRISILRSGAERRLSLISSRSRTR